MRYAFSPLRFVLSLFGLTVVMALVAGTLSGTLGVSLPVAANAILPVVLVSGFEGWHFARRERVPPSAEICKSVSVSMALWGTGTYLALSVLGLIFLSGPAALSQPATLLSLGGINAVFGATFLIVGYFLFRAVARRQITARWG